MIPRKPEPVTHRDHPYASWSSAELEWIAKRDAQWAAWGYSLAPLTPAPEPVRERAEWWPYLWAFAGAFGLLALGRALGALLS